MTIHREGGGFFVECDFCSYYEELESRSFAVTLKDMKKSGWESINFAGQWHSVCPICKGKKETWEKIRGKEKRP